MSKPPSSVIKDFLQSHNRSSESEIKALAKSVLFPEEEVKIWVDHLETVAANRKCGAAKAVATRHARKQQHCHCGVCAQEFMDKTEEVEYWIQCDHCLLWYHWNCAGVQDEPEMFLCAKCQ